MEVIIIAVLYFIIGLLAAFVGSLSGIGGGIVIKPILDLIGEFDVATNTILSATAIFSMSTVSLIILFFSRRIIIKLKTASLLAVSSIFGGIVGKRTFNMLIENVENKLFITLTQSICLICLMILIYIYQKKKHSLKTYNMNNVGFILLSGLFLGVIASFLGIGGGPFNVAVLTIGFSMSAREASANSLFIIFFSQLSSLLTTNVTTGFSSFSLEQLPYIAIGGIIGGIIGSILLNKITNTRVDKIFSAAIVIILVINIFNVVNTIKGLIVY